MSSADNKAVFLSYASRDAEAARRICEALRAAGVEVWIDQSELRGGDTWDQKIRKEIKECALFIPVISANTQARPEGYFRLEWRLADQRTHLMGKSKAFLLPVCIDDTRDADADVPDSFLTVQWVRLPRGAETGEFCARVRALLAGHETASLQRTANGAPLPARDRGPAPVIRVAVLASVTLLAIALGAGVLWWEKRDRPGRSPKETATAAARTTTAAPTETQKLIARIWRIFELQEDGTPEEWQLAEDLGAQAVKLEPASAEAWAAYAAASWGTSGYWRVSSRTSREEGQRRAERAVGLAPDSHDARFVLANYLRSDRRTHPQAEETLRALLRERPDDRRVLRVLAYTLRGRAQAAPDSAEKGNEVVEEALGYLDRAAALPGGDASALTGKCSVLALIGDYEGAMTAANASVALRNGPGALYWKISLLLYLRGDPAGANAALNTAPPSFWRQERNIVLAARVHVALDDLRGAATTLARLPNEWVDGGNVYIGPKGMLTGEVHRRAGNVAAARTDWHSALQAVERRLAAKASDVLLLYWKCWLHASLGERDEAQRAFDLWRQYSGDVGRPGFWSGFSTYGGGGTGEAIALYAQMGQTGIVLDALNSRLEFFLQHQLKDRGLLLCHRLSLEPMWDSLRQEPAFQAAIAHVATFRQMAPATGAPR